MQLAMRMYLSDLCPAAWPCWATEQSAHRNRNTTLWIRNWSHIASHRVLVLVVLDGATLFKKPKTPSFQIH